MCVEKALAPFDTPPISSTALITLCCLFARAVALQIPQPSTTGEQKSKPTQHSVRELRGLGLSPDFIVCRSKNPLQEGISKKIAMFCHVPENQVQSTRVCV